MVINIIFKQTLRAQGKNYSQTQILSAFEEFRKILIAEANASPDKKTHIRELMHSQSIVAGYARRNRQLFLSKKKRLIYRCIRVAGALMEREVQLLEFCARYPEFFASHDLAHPFSTIFWNSDHGKRALMEILSSLDHLTSFLDKDGRPMSFAQTIDHFEWFLNVKLPQPYKIRTQILERKLKCTDFIDRMRRVLIERSEK